MIKMKSQQMLADLFVSRSDHFLFHFLFHAAVLLSTQLLIASSRNEAELVSNLLKDYDYRAHPTTSNGEPIQVVMQYWAITLIDIDERQELLSMLGFIDISWQDPLLSWDMKEYEQYYVVLWADQIWRPDIDIINNFDTKDVLDPTQYRLIVYANGTVAYWTSGVTKTMCRLDLTYFPFDRQACYVELESWTYTDSQVNLSCRSTTPDMSAFHSNEQWQLYDAQVVSYEQSFYDDVYTQFRYVFYIRRKPLYFVTTLIVPCILLSLLSPLVFLLPAEADEKITLGITVLLSFTVFELSISSSMPKTSDYTPIITVYLTCVMMISGLSILCSILVLRVRHGEPSKRAPARLRHLVLHQIARIMLRECACTRTREKPSTDHKMPTTTDAAPKDGKKGQEIKSAHVSARSHRIDVTRTGVRSNVISPQLPATADNVFPEIAPLPSTNNTDESRERTINPVNNVIWQSNQEYRETILSGEGQDDNFLYNVRSSDNNNGGVNEQSATDGGLVATPSDDSHTSFDNLLEWHSMGRVLDRLFFVVFLSATIFVSSTLGFIYAFSAPTTVELTPIA